MNNDDTNWGSDEDEVYYDADSEGQRSETWLNNFVCGSFNKWKTRSLLPLGEFMKRLKKNLEPSTKMIQIEKSLYEQSIEQMKS